MSFDNWNRYLQETFSALNNEQTEKTPAAHSEKALEKSEKLNPEQTPKNIEFINNIGG